MSEGVSKQIRDEVLQLMKEKDDIESKIKQLTTVLTLVFIFVFGVHVKFTETGGILVQSKNNFETVTNNVGMKDPLVDTEGFPIGSINIYEVRRARQQIICLQNDHKAIMKKIENSLHNYYATGEKEPLVTTSQTVKTTRDDTVSKVAFAKIDIVHPNSPAEHSGLQVGDYLVEFGSVNAQNFRTIMDIGAIVQHSEGQQICVKIKRNDRLFVYYLIPKKWSGKGLLGCNVVPLVN